MARPPRHHRNVHQPRPWLEFFLGFVRTPRRFWFTLLGAFVLLILVNPNGAAILLNYLLNNVLLALLPTVILIGCIVWAFSFMFKPLRPKKKKNDH